MKVGVIAAMEQEVVLLRNKMKNRESFVLAGSQFCIGELNTIELVLLKSGIGKTAAALGTTLLLERYNPAIVINIGCAGALVSVLREGDLVVSEEVSYHDVDITAFGYEVGQLVDCPRAFFADRELIKYAEISIKDLNFTCLRGLIVTGDVFINSEEILKRIRFSFSNAIAVDMEAASIAYVCNRFKVPFVVIRSISDKANSKSIFDFNKFLDIASIRSTLVVENLFSILKKVF